jgi:hypothetical protein
MPGSCLPLGLCTSCSLSLKCFLPCGLLANFLQTSIITLERTSLTTLSEIALLFLAVPTPTLFFPQDPSCILVNIFVIVISLPHSSMRTQTGLAPCRSSWPLNKGHFYSSVLICKNAFQSQGLGAHTYNPSHLEG